MNPTDLGRELMDHAFLKRQKLKSGSRLKYLKAEPWDTWADLSIKDEVHGTTPVDAMIFDDFDSAEECADMSGGDYWYIVTACLKETE